MRVGLLGTGSIAAQFADALHSSRDCEAAAVASRELARAESLASRQIAAAVLACVEPIDVVGLASIDRVARVDRYAMGILRFAEDVIAQVSCGKRLVHDDHIRVYGTRGHLHVPEPCWLPSRRDAASEIVLTGPDGHVQRLPVPGGRNILSLEADCVAALLRRGRAASRPFWHDTLANTRTLDR